jgi:hypothetical protein
MPGLAFTLIAWSSAAATTAKCAAPRMTNSLRSFGVLEDQIDRIRNIMFTFVIFRWAFQPKMLCRRAVREVRDLLREDRVLQGRVDDHERRIAAVETRVG